MQADPSGRRFGACVSLSVDVQPAAGPATVVQSSGPCLAAVSVNMYLFGAALLRDPQPQFMGPGVAAPFRYDQPRVHVRHKRGNETVIKVCSRRSRLFAASVPPLQVTLHLTVEWQIDYNWRLLKRHASLLVRNLKTESRKQCYAYWSACDLGSNCLPGALHR